MMSLLSCFSQISCIALALAGGVVDFLRPLLVRLTSGRQALSPVPGAFTGTHQTSPETGF